MSVTQPDSRHLQPVTAKKYGTYTQFLCDYGAISNVMSAAFARPLSFTPTPTGRVVSMLDGKWSNSIRGLVENVHISCCDLTVPITFIVVCSVPLPYNCGLPEMIFHLGKPNSDISLLACLKLRKQFVSFNHYCRTARLN